MLGHAVEAAPGDREGLRDDVGNSVVRDATGGVGSHPVGVSAVEQIEPRDRFGIIG
jgi:ribulose 1,5-bisphosphate carboxylase large subunit-like protein